MKWFDCMSIFLITSSFPSYALAKGREDVITGVIVGLVVSIVIFFILREVVCWYWKINERNCLLKEILEEKKNQTIILENLKHIERYMLYWYRKDVEKHKSNINKDPQVE